MSLFVANLSTILSVSSLGWKRVIDIIAKMQTGISHLLNSSN